MDEKKREEVAARRRAAQEASQAEAGRVVLEPAVTTLKAAGEAYRILRTSDGPDWIPAWIPYGYSHIPWAQLDATIRARFGLHRDAARLPLIEVAIRQRAEQGDRLHIVFEGTGGALSLERDVALRHLEAIIDSGRGQTWITAPPAQWLVEVTTTSVHVGDEIIAPPRE